MSHRIVTGIHSLGANHDFTYFDHQDRARRFNRPNPNRPVLTDGLFALLLGDVGARVGKDSDSNQFRRAGVFASSY